MLFLSEPENEAYQVRASSGHVACERSAAVRQAFTSVFRPLHPSDPRDPSLPFSRRRHSGAKLAFPFGRFPGSLEAGCCAHEVAKYSPAASVNSRNPLPAATQPPRLRHSARMDERLLASRPFPSPGDDTTIPMPLSKLGETHFSRSSRSRLPFPLTKSPRSCTWYSFVTVGLNLRTHIMLEVIFLFQPLGERECL